MEIAIYERPREKLRRKGVSALTNRELVQVLIGSGNAGMPVSKIARKVDAIVATRRLATTVADLMVVQGVGEVKAGQIIVAFELARRLRYSANDRALDTASVLARLYAEVRSTKSQTVFCLFFDGANRVTGEYSQRLDAATNTARIVRNIFGEALSQSATSILIVIGCDKQSLEPTMLELSLARDAYSTARLISIPVKSFFLVGTSGEYVLKEAKNG